MRRAGDSRQIKRIERPVRLLSLDPEGRESVNLQSRKGGGPPKRLKGPGMLAHVLGR